MPESRLHRTRSAYQTNQAARALERRHQADFPLRNRWHVVKHRSRVTWGQWWVDLIYLVRGC